MLSRGAFFRKSFPNCFSSLISVSDNSKIPRWTCTSRENNSQERLGKIRIKSEARCVYKRCNL